MGPGVSKMVFFILNISKNLVTLARNRSYAVELFHGPTFCFKDLGQQVLCRFIAHFVERPTTLIGMQRLRYYVE